MEESLKELLRSIPEMEPVGTHMTSEQKLWRRCIYNAILDARVIFTRARQQFDKTGSCSKAYLDRYNTLMHEINHPWFEQICEWAQFHQDHVKRAIREMADASDFHTIKFRPKYERLYYP